MNVLEQQQPLLLDNAKIILSREIDPHLTQHDIQRMNAPSILDFECDLIFLHIQIIYGRPESVYNFLYQYCVEHGIYSTRMFLNHSLTSIDNRYSITPLECAFIWSDNPIMIRILYQWGADLSMHIQEDISLLPYRNHLSRYVLTNNINNIHPDNYPLNALRIQDQFDVMWNEFNYIVSKMMPPQNWIMPLRIHHLNNAIYPYPYPYNNNN